MVAMAFNWSIYIPLGLPEISEGDQEKPEDIRVPKLIWTNVYVYLLDYW